MYRSRLPALAAVVLVSGSMACEAGPCTSQIVELQVRIARAQASSRPGGAGVPSAPQSIGAQLHHQPTPGAIERAERKANAAGDAALERARNADAAGDAAACGKALQEAEDLYGL
jgi:hypothetical protein